MENIIKIKKLILMLILCGFMIILAMGSFSAANITVANTTNVDEIQNVISGTNGTSLNPGDTITFKEGVYNLSKGFVINQSINIVGENGNVTFIGNGIDLTTSLANFPGTDRFGVHITANSVNLTGITFIGFFYGISVDSASNTLIDNCIAINNRRGIELTNVNGVTINNTKMNNNQREGINFGGNNIHIVDSEMNNNRFEGVHGHASNSGIYNSTINGNGFGAAGTSTMPGIDLHGHGEGVANFTLEGNAVKYNAGAGLDLNIQKATVINNI
ncbi:MAG: right-handed parallel beta-helix repeat-containing protein, partial [Methanobrevibacter sp.]|nr:right-handed parallel beta-helix repeat-containing protein [Methanobrevibacter sp.]